MVERKVVTLFNLEGARWRGGEPYGPIPQSFLVVGPSGLEPPTSRLSVVRSSQLSYGPVVVDAKSAPFVTSSRPSLTALSCVSSPEQTRFAGLCSGTRECTL